MKKHFILYGAGLGLCAACLQWLEYRYFVADHATEIYLGLIALLFTFVGAAAGKTLTAPRRVREIVLVDKIVPVRVPAGGRETPVTEADQAFGISKREREVLQLIAEGLSNTEIADRLCVSLNTVKTHTSSVFQKLNVRRRTQAVQRARSCGII